jgi:hypothetical protein
MVRTSSREYAWVSAACLTWGRDVSRTGFAPSKQRKLGEGCLGSVGILPASFVVHVRMKLSCTKCDCIVQAEALSRPIERGMAGPGLRAANEQRRSIA